MKMTKILARKYTQHRRLPQVRATGTPKQRSSGPSRLPFYGGYLAAIASGCWLVGWTTSIYLWPVGGMALFVLTVHRFWPQRSTQRMGPTVFPATRLGGLARGLCLGTLAFGLAALAVPVIRLLPIHGQYLDRDRATVEQQVRTYVEAGAFDAACRLLERRLGEHLTAKWRHDLQTWQIGILTEAGNKAADTETKVAYWQKAANAAERYGLDAEVAKLKLKAVRDEQIHQKTQAQLQRVAIEARQNRIRDSIAKLKSSSDFAGMDSLLRLEIEDLPREHWPLPLDQLRIDNLINWGDSIDDLDVKEAKYTTALELAQQLERDIRLAKSRLADVRREQESRPAVLPPGAVARVIDVDSATGHKDGPGHVDVEVSASGKFIDGLYAKDFRVLANNSRISFELVELESAEARSVNVVLLLDESPSTANLREIMHRAATTLVQESPETVRFRVMKFSDTAQCVTDWTRDSTQVSQALALPFNGKSTVLRSAIRAAVAELRQRPGSRLLVLITDGKDMAPTPLNDDALVNDCRAAGVRVLAIGLVNEQLDEPLLSQLSAETNGIYLRAEKHQELVDRFRRIKTHVVRPAYRLRFPHPVHEDIAIYIGSGVTQIVLSVPASSIAPPLGGDSPVF